ncbi:aminotransferase class I/II-fold pyridoxal phosphate-dependent enzyme [Mediterraneibacter sp. NSJ-55]|uniref:Aminotransferase class I/II-fold pyridoxal phosphate-dependent enzyme n=1 Tax=Mediterraneibacter hominis TaxID=2763054 RepID=A0A923LK72_9FIRM|nr:aminotransferase class I/II-fold pyridoxal phosphate-dependent enzyme [Mediterraneibacter hominis]MBC5689454.1 aminotransferase class I/II-fold pyridoxal phosphate-dependent enzyme [Mediterraneibacter hominis]
MIKIKASVIANEKMTYVHDNNVHLQIDCAAGINNLLLPECCRKLDLADYPQDNTLLEELACYWSRTAEITADMFLLGNGSQQLLYLVNKLLIEQGTRVLGYAPQYSSYCSDVLFCGGIYRACPMGENYRFELKRFTEQIEQTDTLIYLDNPNNPTGQCIPLEQIEYIVREAAKDNICVLVDEAYGEYMRSENSAITLIKTYDNLIVLRTFSKGFGLAGLRLGYLAARPEIIEEMKKLTSPYDGNTLARRICAQVLKEADFLSNLRNVVRGLKLPIMNTSFTHLKIAWTDVHVPIFMLYHSRSDFELAKALSCEGISVVSGKNFYCVGPNAVRMRVPPREELDEVLKILRKIDQMQ